MNAASETRAGKRPKIQYTEQEILKKALKICDKYSDGVNQLEVVCHANNITDRTFRRWINKYPQVKAYYNDAMTTLKENKAEKMGILALTGQEKLLKGAEYTTTQVIETFDNDWNRTGITKMTTTRQLPPNVQMVKFTMSNFDKKHAQLKPWGDDKHDNQSWMNKEKEPSLIQQEAEALREIEDYKEYLKWKEANNLDNVRHVRTSPIIDKESPDIIEARSTDNDSTPMPGFECSSSNEEGTSHLGSSQKSADTWQYATSQQAQDNENAQNQVPRPDEENSIDTQTRQIEKEQYIQYPYPDSITSAKVDDEEEIQFDTDEEYWDKYWRREHEKSWQASEENNHPPKNQTSYQRE